MNYSQCEKGKEEMENELVVFEQQNLEVFQKLQEFKKQQDLMKKQEEALKKQLEESMTQYGIKSFKNDYVNITYVEGSSSESIDLKKMQEKEPELYAELLADYKKVTNKKGYVRIVVK